MSKLNHKEKADLALEISRKLIRESNGRIINIFMKRLVLDKKEEALEYANVAAKTYKLIKDSEGYLYALLIKAELERQLKYLYDYPRTLIGLGNFFSNDADPSYADYYDEKKAIKYYFSTLEFYIENNQYDQIYNLYTDIMRIYEKNHDTKSMLDLSNDILEKYEHMLTVIDRRKFKERLADICYEHGIYQEAASYYRDVAQAYLASRFGKYSAERCFYNSLICTLATGDLVATINEIDIYNNDGINYGTSVQMENIQCLVQAIRDYEHNMFTNIIKEIYTNNMPPNDMAIYDKIETVFFDQKADDML